jgi:hypothetical protein
VGVAAGIIGAFQGASEDADRDASGHVAERSDMSVLKLRTGDCFNAPELMDPDRTDTGRRRSLPDRGTGLHAGVPRVRRDPLRSLEARALHLEPDRVVVAPV